EADRGGPQHAQSRGFRCAHLPIAPEVACPTRDFAVRASTINYEDRPADLGLFRCGGPSSPPPEGWATLWRARRSPAKLTPRTEPRKPRSHPRPAGPQAATPAPERHGVGRDTPAAPQASLHAPRPPGGAGSPPTRGP